MLVGKFKSEWDMSGRRCSVICKDKKELMVPFYLSQLLQNSVLYFFPMSVMGLLVCRYLLLLKLKVKSLAVGLVALLRTCECLLLFCCR